MESAVRIDDAARREFVPHVRQQAHQRLEASALGFKANFWVPWALVFSEVLALQLSLLGGYAIRQALAGVWPIRLDVSLYRNLSLVFLTLPLGSYLYGLYPGYGLTGAERIRRCVLLTVGFFALLMVGDYLLFKGGLSRGALLIALMFALFLVPALKGWAIKTMIDGGWWGTPIVVIGAANTGVKIIEAFHRDRLLGFRPIAVLDDDSRKWSMYLRGVPVMGPIDRAGELVSRVSHAVVAMPGAGRDRLVKLTASLPFPHIIIVPDLFGIQSLWVEARDLSGMVGLELKKNLLQRRNRVIKRGMDYLLGIPFFLLSLPIIGVCALWIRCISPGSPFYFQEREGYEGKGVRVWKLRTMYRDADKVLEEKLGQDPLLREEWFRYFKLKNDPRILPWVGNFLRKASLDELPQLWNVIKGEMSLVGPRPFPYYHLEKFDQEFRSLRNNVLPGITGLWQVLARSNGDLQVQEDLDSYYIRNWSIWVDFNLLGRTIGIVLRRKGAY